MRGRGRCKTSLEEEKMKRWRCEVEEQEGEMSFWVSNGFGRVFGCQKVEI